MQERIVAKIFLENSSGEILILRRSHTAPRRALEWDLPGGWVELGEDPLQAAIRELKEEAGIVIESLQEALMTTDEQDMTIIRHYLIGITGNPPVTLSYEHDQYKWIAKNKFVTMVGYVPHVGAFGTIYGKTI